MLEKDGASQKSASLFHKYLLSTYLFPYIVPVPGGIAANSNKPK